MEIRRARSSATVRTEGGLLPSDLLAKIAAAERDVPGLLDADFGLASGERLREAITRSWNRLVGAWAALEAVRVAAGPIDPLTGATRERFLLPLMDELGFGRLPLARAPGIEGMSYPISHGWTDRVPVHLVGFGVDLDGRTKGVRGAAGAAPHALVQEYLNRSNVALWGLVSNGRTLRLLRDSTSLTRQAYVEFDLDAIFAGELYADFALLWSVCHRTRFEGERPADCLLEQWTKKAAEDGTRALDKLRGGVEKAIETLGAGFLATRGNETLAEALRSGALDRQDYYRELLRLVYRLIFLFTAEDRRDEATGRELLLDPAAPDDAVEHYRRYYSTVRLRAFAGRRRGTRHPDLWVSLRQVMTALGTNGAPTIALPALGSFLFGSEACPHLDRADLRNEDLLDAVRALATIEEDRRLRLVDYRNLGAEELGGVYEGLLELHPRIELDANPPRFILGTAAGNERKATGSYYTPSSLINCLLDSALDPVVNDTVRGKKPDEAERAILELAVVDPAAGSGHFLVAAAHRLAKRLATIRTGEGEPAPAAVRHALREVIAHCIYAVDVNPMAVELCKVSLWLEALEPGRPLSFLDGHIKIGNSLIGTTPELVAGGIPDAAYVALTGDDKAVARAWRIRNRQERDGQQALFEVPLEIGTEAFAREVRSLDTLPEETPAAVAAKAARHAAYVASSDYQRARAALDAWCSAFVAPKAPGAPEITTATFRAIGTNPAAVPAAVRDLVETAATEYAFFHWPLEFPAVFERGGFDVVVGNPPWERVKLQEKEFFVERRPAIADARNAAERKRMIVELERSDPALWQSFQGALRRSDGESHVLRDSGFFPLAGRGDINTYAVFTELAVRVAGARGWVGIVVPTAVATDETTSPLFRHLVESRSLRSLYDFRNSDAMFRDVGHRRFKFCLLTATPAGRSPSADLAFFAVLPPDLDDSERHFRLTAEDFALLNPNTRTSPTFRSGRAAEIVKSIYRRVPVLGDDSSEEAGGPWGISFLRMFDMATDSRLFLDTPGSDRLPLYEAKMVFQFDHRHGDYRLRPPLSRDTELPTPDEVSHRDPIYSVTPLYWVAEPEVRKREGGMSGRGWHLGFRDVTNATNERTLVASAVPRAAVGHKLPLIQTTRGEAGLLLVLLNSMCVDWVARQKLGGMSMSYFVLRQLPILSPAIFRRQTTWGPALVGDWVRRYVTELVVTSNDLKGFGQDLGWAGPAFVWNSERRSILRAELDAAVFLLYGLTTEEVDVALEGFPIVREHDRKRHGAFQTKELILEAYDAMANATLRRPFVSRLDPPPGDARAANPARSGEAPGHWLPWSEVIARSPGVRANQQGPRQSTRPPSLPAPSPRATKPPMTPPLTPTAPLPQPTLGLSASADGDPRWTSETAVKPAAILMGQRVRHRSRGTGTVMRVKPTGKTAELLIRFDVGGEAWMAFGYGVLEFQR